MSEPDATDEHSWVTALLAADHPGPMPDEFADRILAAIAHGASTGTPSSRAAGSSPLPATPPRQADEMPPPAAAFVPPPADLDATAAIDITAAKRKAATDRPDGPFDAIAAVRRRRGAGARRIEREEAASDRRHFLLYRMLPVAASMVVLAAASGVTAALVDGGANSDTAGTAALGAADSAAESVGLAPNGLVATGTRYTQAGLADQAKALLAAVSQGSAARDGGADPNRGADPTVPAAASVAAGDAGAAPQPVPSAQAFAEQDPLVGNPLVSAQAYQQCAVTLGAAAGVLPAAIDLAIYEGTEAAIVLLPNRAGDGYEVIVTDRRCNPQKERMSASFLAE